MCRCVAMATGQPKGRRRRARWAAVEAVVLSRVGSHGMDVMVARVWVLRLETSFEICIYISSHGRVTAGGWEGHDLDVVILGVKTSQ